MDPPWGYSTTRTAAQDCAIATLTLEATTDVPRSIGLNSSFFPTRALATDLSLYLDSVQLPHIRLDTCAVVRQVVHWLTQNLTRLGFDAVGVPYANETGVVTIPLHVGSRSARHEKTLVIDSPATPRATLSRVNLRFNFVSLSNSASDPYEPGAEHTNLTCQLLAQYPESLHFTLGRQVDSTLADVFQQLAQVYPLCFNPIWSQRLENDLGPLRSISNSLVRILDRSSLISCGNLELDEVNSARDLLQDLVPLFSSPSPSISTSTSTSTSTTTTTTSNSQSTVSAQKLTQARAIELGLLVIAKQRGNGKLIDRLDLSSLGSALDESIDAGSSPASATGSRAGARKTRERETRGGRNSRASRGRTTARGRGRGRDKGRERRRAVSTSTSTPTTGLRRGARKRKSLIDIEQLVREEEEGSSGSEGDFSDIDDGSEEETKERVRDSEVGRKRARISRGADKLLESSEEEEKGATLEERVEVEGEIWLSLSQ